MNHHCESSRLLAYALSLTVSVLLPSEVTGIGGLPGPNHAVLVILENHGSSSIIRSPDPPFINALAEQGASLTRFFAVTRPSQPNYLAIFSGSLQNVDENAYPNNYTAPNLASALFRSRRFPGTPKTYRSRAPPSVGQIITYASTALG